MEGSLVVQEERKNVNKFQKWYQEKIIDTGKSQKASSPFIEIMLLPAINTTE